jgi:hypothetical protein
VLLLLANEVIEEKLLLQVPLEVALEHARLDASLYLELPIIVII